ncbi:MAG: DUF6525 family protein [Pseudomonadota bacterium]
MRKNRGQTSLRRKRRTEDPMREFDRLPAPLRNWLAGAVLPWRPRSAKAVFARAMARTRNEAEALAELDRLQARLIDKDIHYVWGADHPGVQKGAVE